MIKFAVLCKDNVTNLEMVASECTFNESCIFLERENANNRFGRFLSARGKNEITEIIYEKASFLYDEKRGLLLRHS